MTSTVRVKQDKDTIRNYKSTLLYVFLLVCVAVLGENVVAHDGHIYCAYVDKKVNGPEDGKLQIGEDTPVVSQCYLSSLLTIKW